MAILPPEDRLWWNERLSRPELIWISVAFLWGLVMFFTMIGWHFIGEQNFSNEAYRISPDTYAERADAMVEEFTVRTEGDDEIPVVHPLPGTDIYMVARTFEWWPILELEVGQKYRLHLSSVDVQHGFSLQPENINIQVVPGIESVMTITPDKVGTYGVICNEFCGIGHHQMTGRIYVVQK